MGLQGVQTPLSLPTIVSTNQRTGKSSPKQVHQEEAFKSISSVLVGQLELTQRDGSGL